jgi:hypothetical protein
MIKSISMMWQGERKLDITLIHLNAFIIDPKNEDFFSFSFTEGLRSLLSLSRRLLCGRSRCSSGVILSAWRRDGCRELEPSVPASRDVDGKSERSRGLSPLLCARLVRSTFPEPETSYNKGELVGCVSRRGLRGDSTDAL